MLVKLNRNFLLIIYILYYLVFIELLEKLKSEITILICDQSTICSKLSHSQRVLFLKTSVEVEAKAVWFNLDILENILLRLCEYIFNNLLIFIRESYLFIKLNLIPVNPYEKCMINVPNSLFMRHNLEILK